MEQLVIKIAGIGQVTSVILTKHGFKTVADVANATVESLSVVPGFANARSLQAIQRAKALLQTENISVSKEVTDPVTCKEKLVSKKLISNKKATKKSKNKEIAKNKKNKKKKAEKNILKLVAKELANKITKLKDKKPAKDKAKKVSNKTATKKKSSKKSSKKSKKK